MMHTLSQANCGQALRSLVPCCSPPDQVIANVQTALQQQGYYQGEVDGLLGPQTRAAIADYQRANGLPETAAVDQPTLQSLGMA